MQRLVRTRKLLLAAKAVLQDEEGQPLDRKEVEDYLTSDALVECRHTTADGTPDTIETIWYAFQLQQGYRAPILWRSLPTAEDLRPEKFVPVETLGEDTPWPQSLEELQRCCTFFVLSAYLQRHVLRHPVVATPEIVPVQASLLRSDLMAALALSQPDAFYDTGRRLVRQTFLSLASENAYFRRNPNERGLAKDMNFLQDDLVGVEAREAFLKQLNHNPRTEWASMLPCVQEMWLLAAFLQGFQSRQERPFLWLLLWGDIGTARGHSVLTASRELGHRLPLPLIVQLGWGRWCVLDPNVPPTRLCTTDVVEAIAIWKHLVKGKHGGKAEDGTSIL
jgi:hypothetical protein